MKKPSRKRHISRLAAAPVIVTVALLSFTTAPAPRSAVPVSGMTALSAAPESNENPAPVRKKHISFAESKMDIYDSLHLEGSGLSKKAFRLALNGMGKLMLLGKIRSNILSIVDFSQPSTSRRLYVIDLDNYQLLFQTWVAHGMRSGKTMAQLFSNKSSSHKSSLGFYVTHLPYMGNNGYSLKLEGVEKGINDNAMRRAIVVHGADYVNEDFIASQGYIGRSQGCPAVTPEVCHPLINEIKDGTCLFIYYPSTSYIKRSRMVR